MSFIDASTPDLSGISYSAPSTSELGWVNSYGAAFQPSSVTAGAGSWLDVLKYGIGRVADYKVATLAVQNKEQQVAVQDAPQVQITGSAADRAVNQGGGISLGTLALLAGAFFLLRG